MNNNDDTHDLPETPVNVVYRLEKLCPSDFHRTTYAERQNERRLQEQLFNGEITLEDAERQRNEAKESRRSDVLRIATEQGLEKDLNQIAAIQAAVDQA